MFKKSHLRGAAVTAAIFVSLALVACTSETPAGNESEGAVVVPGADEEANAYLNELYDDAIATGETDVVVYGPAVSTQAPLAEVFSARFPGITVIPQDAADSVNITKLQTEAASGNRIADLFMGGGGALAAAAAQPGVCTNAEVKTAPEEDLSYSPDGLVLTYSYRYFGFVYNTDLVAEEDIPNSWEDLLDPQWKGKILAADPTILGATRFIFVDLLLPESEDKWGESYLTALAAQDLQIASSEPNIPADVASGRYPIGIGVYSGFYAAQKAKGGPIALAFPLEDGGNFFAAAGICAIEDAPHASASALYVNWLFTQEGQEAMAEVDDGFGALPGSPGPAGVPSIEDAGSLPLTNPDPAFNEPYFAIIDRLFKKS